MKKWQCTKCGSKNKGKANFCLNCGNPFAAEDTSPAFEVNKLRSISDEKDQNATVIASDTVQDKVNDNCVAETGSASDIITDAVLEIEGTSMNEPAADIVVKKSSKKRKVFIISAITGFVLIVAAIVYLFVFSGLFGSKKDENNLFDDDRLVFCEDGKYGYIDSSGKIVIEASFDSADDFSNGLASVESDGKWGYIDTEGKVIIDYQFDSAGTFSKYGFAVVCSEDKNGVINTKGDFILDMDYDRAYQVAKNRFMAGNKIEKDDDSWTKDYKLNLYDEKGDKVCAAEFTHTNYEYKQGLLAVCNKSGKWGYINDKGEYEIDAKFASASDFSEDLAAVGEKKGFDDNDISIYKYGYINKKGEVEIRAQYDSAESFSDGLAVVEEDGKYGYIDKNNETVIDFEYDTAESFEDGYAVVGYEKGKDSWDYIYGLIDKNGKQKISIDYDSIIYGNSMYRCEKEGECQYLTEEGKSAIEGTFYRATVMFDDGYAVVSNDDKRFEVIDKNGKKITDTDFEGLYYYNSDDFCKIEDCYNSSTYNSSEGYCEKHYEEYENPHDLVDSMWTYNEYSSNKSIYLYLFFHDKGKGRITYTIYDYSVEDDDKDEDLEFTWKTDGDTVNIIITESGAEITFSLIDDDNGYLEVGSSSFRMERYVDDDDYDDL